MKVSIQRRPASQVPLQLLESNHHERVAAMTIVVGGEPYARFRLPLDRPRHRLSPSPAVTPF